MANSKNSKGEAKASSGSVKTCDTPQVDSPSAQVHSFSRTIADEHGEKAAVMLQYLGCHVGKRNHVHSGKHYLPNVR